MDNQSVLLVGRKQWGSEGGSISSSSSFNDSSSAGSKAGEFETSGLFPKQFPYISRGRALPSRHDQPKLHDNMCFIESFPTQRAQRIARITRNLGVNSSHTHLAWRDFKTPAYFSPHEKMIRALETTSVLREIRRSLEIPGSGEPNNPIDLHPYLLENLTFAKKREIEYASLFLRKNLTKEEIKWRDKQIKFILKASQEFKLEVETTLIACFYVDGFLYRQQVKSAEEMEALAYAAIFAASKLEEIYEVSLNKLFEKFFSLLRFHKQTILSKELEILSVLKFHSYPPTMKYMLDAAMNRDCINFLPGTKLHIEQLALALIIMSLKEPSFSRIKSSVKTLTVLEVASEFVMYHWDKRSLYSQDYRVREKPVISETMISASFEVLCDLLRQKVTET